jgi:hypothetical protein
MQFWQGSQGHRAAIWFIAPTPCRLGFVNAFPTSPLALDAGYHADAGREHLRVPRDPQASAAASPQRQALL